MKTDPYKTLGVSCDASPADIKRAYYDRARQHHPDKENGNTGAMVEINRAYDCLGDTERRKLYDQTGQMDKARGIDADIQSVLLQVFMAALQNDAPNVLDYGKAALKESLSKLKVQLDAIQKAESKLISKQGKVTVKKAGVENVFQMLLDEKLVEVRQAILTTNKGIEIHELAIKQLRQYLSTEPTVQAASSHVIWGVTGATTGTGW